MDITNLFKACVRTIYTRNKAFGTNAEFDKHRIISSKKKDRFQMKAKEVLTQITNLRDFLLEHRKAYLNFASHISGISHMTDLERDKIDSGAQRIMKSCCILIKDFRRECLSIDGSLQLLGHQEAVLELLENYLKSVCKIFSEQKVIRGKRSRDFVKLSKLESSPTRKSISVSSKEFEEKVVDNFDENKENVTENTRNVKMSSADCDFNSSIEGETFSPEELQLFQSENITLFNELNSVTEEVRQIESKVVKIAELQEIFTEKVIEQEKDIDRIVNTLVGSTENVKDANEQIRQAIQRNAGLRVWILFFLLIMSFSLLFLDWYND